MMPGSIAAVIVFSIVLAACGRPDSGFDMTTLEAAIPEAIVPDDPSVVTDVSCPQLPTSEPTTTMCTALVGGRAIEINANITADGLVEISTDAVLLDISGVASEAGHRLSDDLGIDSSVSCPGSVRVVAVGDTITCEATDPAGSTHNVVITVTDPSGTWTMDLTN